MSLKFGIYLVEQRIVSPEQFCGLVKIQQESIRTLASLAIANNFLTMKQVSRLLDSIGDEDRRFVEVATEKGMLEPADAKHLVLLQEQSGESIRSLAVECGLLSERQCEVLFNHFQRYGSRTIQQKKRPSVSKPAAAKPAAAATPSRPVHQPKMTPSPKFKKHPIITVSETQH